MGFRLLIAIAQGLILRSQEGAGVAMSLVLRMRVCPLMMREGLQTEAWVQGESPPSGPLWNQGEWKCLRGRSGGVSEWGMSKTTEFEEAGSERCLRVESEEERSEGGKI